MKSAHLTAFRTSQFHIDPKYNLKNNPLNHVTKLDVSEFVVHSQILEKFANFQKVYFSENLDFTKIFLEIGFKSLHFPSKTIF